MLVDIPQDLVPLLDRAGFSIRQGMDRRFLVKRQSKESRAAENRAALKRLLADGITDQQELQRRVGLRPGQYRYLMAQILEQQQRCVKRDYGRPPVARPQPVRVR